MQTLTTNRAKMVGRNASVYSISGSKSHSNHLTLEASICKKVVKIEKRKITQLPKS